MMKLISKHTVCRLCKQKRLTEVFSFGMTPLANAFLTKNQLDQPEPFYPLDVYLCQNCGLLQLGHVVSPEILFRDYVYVSSTSPVFCKHFEEYAQDVHNKFKLTAHSLVVDIGSNDGVLLKPFRKLGVQVLGIEPASNIAKHAQKDGIETIIDFLNPKLASSIFKNNGKAKIITANNVFAHIDDWDNFMQSADILLDDDGVLVIEAPYLIDFIEKNYFDIVYHEHLSYIALKPLNSLFRRFSMELFDAERVDVHGGSIRLFVKRRMAAYKTNKNIDSFIKREENLALFNQKTYKRFFQEILNNKAALISLLTKIKNQGKSIAGYGAPAKAATLLTFFGMGREFLDYVVDDSPFKQGLYMPGSHIPVVSSDSLRSQKPDYLLILAWNFAPSIMENQKDYKNSGGRFIIPIPKAKVI